MRTDRRVHVIAAYAVVIVALVALASTRRAAPPAVDLGADYDGYYDAAYPTDPAVPVNAPPAPATTTTVATTTTPAVATEEATPAAGPPAGDGDAAAATAVGFLHGWTLRGSWDERLAALRPPTGPPLATVEYATAVAYTDPEQANLPAGTTITVDPGQVTVTATGAATVPATVDGIAVVVSEVRTGTGWVVNSHRQA